MSSRREIREAAIQFLYCNDLEEGAPADEASDAFWELLLESDFSKLTKASVKSVLHLNQGRQKRYVKLVEKSPELESLIFADPNAKKLGRALAAVIKSENKWQALIDSMSRIYKPQNEEVQTDLSDVLNEIYLLNNTLTVQRKAWEEQLADYPQFKVNAESVNASIGALQRVSDRIHMVKNPTLFPAHSDVAHLVATAEKMKSMRNSVDQKVTLVTANKDKIDEMIHSVVENYVPERINPVDRAILRLGAAEILFDDALPAPVSINEAVEIAQKFASSDSSKFINGILDKIAKTIAPSNT
ncbi:MAG: transcription antitermination factor NusB [Akkermansiaceae bacterium]